MQIRSVHMCSSLLLRLYPSERRKEQCWCWKSYLLKLYCACAEQNDSFVSVFDIEFNFCNVSSVPIQDSSVKQLCLKGCQRPFSSDFTISKSKLFKTFNSFRSLVYDTVLTIWRKSRPTPPPSVPWSLEPGLHKTQVLTCLNSSDLTIYLLLFQESQIPGKSPPPSSRPARFPAANGMFAIL